MTDVRYKLPRLSSLTARGFSIFESTDEITVDLSKPLSCFAGANGIGKSTLMTAINYGLTGLTPIPRRSYATPSEYFEDALRRATTYFDGRIQEHDRDKASISLSFTVGEHSLIIERPLFESGSLRSLVVTPEVESIEFDDEISPQHLDSRYQRVMCHLTGFSDFAQFAYLQLFLFTFDERRYALFFDQDLLRQTLHFGLGIDPQIIRRSEEYRRAASKQESLARNSAYAARQVTVRINEFLRSMEVIAPPEDLKQFDSDVEELVRRRDELNVHLDSRLQEMDDSRVAHAENLAEFLALRSDYNDLYDNYSGPASSSLHPIVERTLDTHVCSICGQHRDDLSNVQSHIENNKCPLCAHELTVPTEGSEPELLTQLRQIDERLAELKATLDSERSKQARLESEIETARSQRTEYDALLKESGPIVGSADDAASTQERADDFISAQKDQRRQFLKERDEHRKLRDEARNEYRKLQKDIVSRIQNAESHFLPLFKRLSFAFLGIDLDISITSGERGASLVLEVDGQVRRNEQQLSESQRFFIDIALRMALSSFMVGAEPMTLLIDTPEGSLDAAYESRAGLMFSQFLKEQNCIVMTANINTSFLLRRLAKECRTERMSLIRMTDWAKLSDVQLEEEAVFEKAYEDIQAELDGVGTVNWQN